MPSFVIHIPAYRHHNDVECVEAEKFVRFTYSLLLQPRDLQIIGKLLPCSAALIREHVGGLKMMHQFMDQFAPIAQAGLVPVSAQVDGRDFLTVESAQLRIWRRAWPDCD